MANPMQTTEDYDADNFKLNYYHDTSIHISKGQLYNDDGHTVNAQVKEQYELLYFYSEYEKRNLKFEFESRTGINYTSENKTIDFIIHNIQKKPKRIKLNGKRKVVDWNEASKTITIPVVWNISKTLKINLKF